ncbi:MAG: glycosyltransferase family 4 protein [Acidobacteriota bacterium]
MSRTVRVLVVGPLPPPFGGMPRFVQILLGSHLADEHSLVHFNTALPAWARSYSMNTGHRRYQPQTKGFQAKYGYLFSCGVWQAVKTLAAGLISLPAFAVSLAGSDPDVVHLFSNMHWGFWRLGAMACVARLARRHVIFHPLGAIDQFYPACGSVGRWCIRTLLDRADLVLVQSPGLARKVRELTRRPVKGIFNGIDVEPLARLARPSPRGSGKVGFLAVGDLGHNKGTWDILQAAGLLRRHLPEATWTFIGRGEIQDHLQRAEAAGVGDAVAFLGPVPEGEKMAAYAAADVFLLPSYGEGQPLSILEAMAAGLPVISTPVGSIGEVIAEGKNGFLVPPGDVKALSEAMLKLALDPELRERMGRANRQEACRRFDARRLFKEIESCWLNLMAGQRR